METLITKLEREVGLTHEQAVQSVNCFREYMRDNDLHIDWESFLKAKSHKVSEKGKQAFNQLFGDPAWADKASDNINEFVDKAKQSIKDARNKAADFIADKD